MIFSCTNFQCGFSGVSVVFQCGLDFQCDLKCHILIAQREVYSDSCTRQSSARHNTQTFTAYQIKIFALSWCQIISRKIWSKVVVMHGSENTHNPGRTKHEFPYVRSSDVWKIFYSIRKTNNMTLLKQWFLSVYSWQFWASSMRDFVKVRTLLSNYYVLISIICDCC